MPSSFSTDLKLELMVTGENAGTWGTKTNTNLNLLQQAIAGFQSISIAGGAQTTALTMDNAAISNARNAVIKLTGTITGNQVVTVPNGIEKTYIVSNGTTGAFTVQFKTASGTGPTFSTTDKGIKILFADGTNVVDVNANFSASSFPQINDSNGNEEIKFTTTASAVNELTVTNAATGNGPEISATGSDTNIDLKLTPKGTGKLNLDGIKFPNADGSSGQFLRTDGSGVLSFASAGLAWQSVQTTNFTAVKGNAYPCNTTSSAFTVTLPATPSAGDQVQVVDYAGTFDTNKLIIDGNGEDIEGLAEDFELTGEREGVILTYIDSTQGWIATSGINEGTDALQRVPFTVDFLVIAGGGGGSAGGGEGGGGGGGAGGYRTSAGTSGGGGSAESSLTLSVATNYTVTVGGGGSAGINPSPAVAGKGSDSVFSTITSAGGGGGSRDSFGSTANINGGSGGGRGGSSIAGTGTANQGFDGGGVAHGGGGGGAGALGTNGPNGAGGAGVASTITGPSATRAGGGGGGTGAGGSGGGGAGGNPGTAGTVNTGGGGGAGTLIGPSATSGAAGGSGIVIIKYPDTLTVTNPGGGLTSSTSSSGGFKITSFTAGTGTIQFN